MIRGITVSPGCFRGSIEAVASKSDAHRALIAASLAKGTSRLTDWGESDDVKITLTALEKMGLARAGAGYTLTGGGSFRGNLNISCGQSGSTLRFLIPLTLALGQGAIFTGEGRLMQRPLTVYEEIFTQQGILWKLEENQLTVRGCMHGGELFVPGNISSQFITGLCFALPLLQEDSHIHFTTPLESSGYVKMTLNTLKAFGITISWEEGGLTIPGRQVYRPCEYVIEGDWSYGAFWIVGGAVNGDVTIEKLHEDTLQGDARIAEILREMGADIHRDGTSLRVRKSTLKGTKIDLADIPDLAPVLAVAACAARGRTEFMHAGRLKMKESDRLQAIYDMIKALGGSIDTTDDSFMIHGMGMLEPGKVQTRHDHRMAMAAAIASGIARGEIDLDDRDCVAKSAPQFWDHFEKLGGEYHE